MKRDVFGAVVIGAIWIGIGSIASAQSVWVVDDTLAPGVHFVDIPAAIAAANDGDTILVRDGTYSGFAVNSKGLAVVGDSLTAPKIDGPISVIGLGFSQKALIRGLETGAEAGVALTIDQNIGAVRIEDCVLTGENGHNTADGLGGHPKGHAAVEVTASVHVVFSRCALEGGDGGDAYNFYQLLGEGGSGLKVDTSKVAFIESDATGGRGGDDIGSLTLTGGRGGLGGEIAPSQVYSAGSTFRGGMGGSGGDNYLWGGCANGGPGGVGLELFAAQFIQKETALIGGAGGFGTAHYGCSNGPVGLPTTEIGSVVESFPGLSKGFGAPAVFRAQAQEPLVFEGSAGDGAFLLLSATPGYAVVPGASGVLLTSGTPLLIFMGTIPAQGTLTVLAGFSSLPAGIESVWMHGQAAFLSASGKGTLDGHSSLLLLSPGL